MRCFLDANIIFSASLPHSRVATLVGLLFSQGECVTSNYALREASKNLRRKAPDQIGHFLLLRRKLGISDKLTPTSVSLPDKDLPILEGAIALECSHLITGDEKHFGELWGQTVAGVKIVSPVMMLDELNLKETED